MTDGLRFLQELIETLWNVNYFKKAVEAGIDEELIETLWNVNYDKFIAMADATIELIETLWNVNEVIVTMNLDIYMN